MASLEDAGGPEGPAVRPELLFDLFDERLDACREPSTVASTVLDEAMALHGAQFGTMQLLDRNQRDLIIVAHRGFDWNYLSLFKTVSAHDNCSAARALRSQGPVLVPDVDGDPLYEPYRGIAAEAGYRAVQSSPLVATDGRMFGVLSTHFAEPHRPSQFHLSMARLYGLAASNPLRRLAGYNPLPRVIPFNQPDEPADKPGYLDLANKHIADTMARIVRQQDVVDRLRARGMPLQHAEDLLRILGDSLELMLWHRRIIKRGQFGD